MTLRRSLKAMAAGPVLTLALSPLGLVALAPVAQAKVARADERGFIIQQLVEVPVSAAEAWERLLTPAKWWDSAHTWSADAANLSLDAKAGGCFCELLPNPDSPRAAPRGSVEHMRVIYVERPRVLRMSGALGPLQQDAANGTMTIQLKALGKGRTQVLLEYAVGGYLRAPADQLAPAVDAMLAAQLKGLAVSLGAKSTAAPDVTSRPESEPEVEPMAGSEPMGEVETAPAPQDEPEPEPEADPFAEAFSTPEGESAAETIAPLPDGGTPGVLPPLQGDVPQIEMEEVEPDGIQPLADTPPEGEYVGR